MKLVSECAQSWAIHAKKIIMLQNLTKQFGQFHKIGTVCTEFQFHIVMTFLDLQFYLDTYVGSNFVIIAKSAKWKVVNFGPKIYLESTFEVVT